MTVLSLAATRFEQVLPEGRTRPIVLACRSTENGVASRSVLCKAKGCPEVYSSWQLVCEVVGNAVARQMGVQTPPASVVEISDRLAGIVNQNLQEFGFSFEIEAGYAAGCDFLPGLIPWTIDQNLTPEFLAQAGRMFAFDQMCQNPDRRREKVNCGLTKGGLLAFDFEMCFSHCFLPIIGQAEVNPWEPSHLGLARNHLFYSELKANPPTEDSVRELAHALSSDWWEAVKGALPEQWQADAEKIGEELRKVHEHAADFAKDLTRRCLI